MHCLAGPVRIRKQQIVKAQNIMLEFISRENNFGALEQISLFETNSYLCFCVTKVMVFPLVRPLLVLSITDIHCSKEKECVSFSLKLHSSTVNFLNVT